MKHTNFKTIWKGFATAVGTVCLAGCTTTQSTTPGTVAGEPVRTAAISEQRVNDPTQRWQSQFVVFGEAGSDDQLADTPAYRCQRTLDGFEDGRDVTFNPGSAKITATHQARLTDLATCLDQEYLKDIALLIEGHADRTGPDSKNRQLAAKRAEAVRTYLIDQGVEPDRMRALSMGEQLADGETAIGQRHDRRVNVVLVEQL